ncbi:uncharacterized protein B0H18DRAFT_1123395 [Fomitopsis serialis]|uniref:uncharacterized protein n=1 Tax=Fomitopsis serialis TaxID=139415 RepID=UPI0020085004|nr:uncharacterized protein B0H18DRAFT_1123395 [Neoantrodia serialis]KAH9917778.1 hypothetical protein B0H18DRAFT_1123395 [Neoantrodia serialis]
MLEQRIRVEFRIIVRAFALSLVQKADTHRSLDLVSTIAVCTYWFNVDDPRLVTIEWGRTFMVPVVVAKPIAFARNYRFKLVEKELVDGRDRYPPYFPFAARLYHLWEATHRGRVFLQWFRNPSAIVFTVRGIGWDFGKGVYGPEIVALVEAWPILESHRAVVIDILDLPFKSKPRAGK